jgi:hypothetical protein
MTDKGKLYNQLFEARQEGDYVDFVSFDRDLVEPWVLKVKEFIDDIKHLSENQYLLPRLYHLTPVIFICLQSQAFNSSFLTALNVLKATSSKVKRRLDPSVFFFKLRLNLLH